MEIKKQILPISNQVMSKCVYNWDSLDVYAYAKTTTQKAFADMSKKEIFLC